MNNKKNSFWTHYWKHTCFYYYYFGLKTCKYQSFPFRYAALHAIQKLTAIGVWFKLKAWGDLKPYSPKKRSQVAEYGLSLTMTWIKSSQYLFYILNFTFLSYSYYYFVKSTTGMHFQNENGLDCNFRIIIVRNTVTSLMIASRENATLAVPFPGMAKTIPEE